MAKTKPKPISSVRPASKTAGSRDKGQTVAILSYITVIGWIIALILHGQKKTVLGSFHLQQTLLLYIAAIVFGWIPYVKYAVWIVLFIFWIIGLIGAIQERNAEMPLIGKWAHDWFKGI